MDRPDVRVRTTVHATESRERVERAIRNLFPGADFEYDASTGDLVARASSAERLSELVDEQEIHHTARDVLLDSAVGDTVVFRLSKQPAVVGRLNFDVGGHELGALTVRIEVEDPEAFVDSVTSP